MCAICARVVEDDAIDANDAVVHQRLAGIDSSYKFFGYLFAGEVLALKKHVLNGVDIDSTVNRFEVITAAAVVADEDVSQFSGFAGADREVDVNSACIDVLEQVFDVAVVQLFGIETKTE